MTNNKDAMRWLLSELPKLRKNGVLDEAAAEALAGYCNHELELKPPPRKFIYTLFYIGAGMIAAGIVLFFNYNWDYFSRRERIAISSLPMLLAFIVAMITILRQKNQLWREFSAVLTATGAGVLIAMLSQIYHIGGDLCEYMTLLLAVSLPFVYIFNSIALTTAYVFGLFPLLAYTPSRPLYCFAAALGILPMMYIHLRPGGENKVWTRYLMILLAAFGILGCGLEYYPPLSCFAVAGTMIYAGWAHSEQRESHWRNPWLVCSFVFMLLLLAQASSNARFFNLTSEDSRTVAAYWLFTGVVLATNVLLFPKSRLDEKRLTTGLLVLLPLLRFCGVDEPVMKLIFNIYMGAYGAILMLDGFRRSRLLTYNGGVAMVLLLIVCRFFDSELGLLHRSVAFVIIGAGLIAANFAFSRRFRITGR